MNEIPEEKLANTLYSKPIPVAHKQLDLNISKKKGGKYKVTKILVLFFFIVAALFSLLAGYLYFMRTNKILERKDLINVITDNNITKEQAEWKNLSLIQKSPVDFNSLEASSIITVQGVYPFVRTNDASVKNIEIKSDGTIVPIDTALLESTYSNIFYINQDSIDQLEVEIENLSKNISDFVIENEIINFELDVSLTYLNNYRGILESINNDLAGYDYELVIYLFPKWGNEVDYSNYATISNKFHREMNLKEISTLVDKIKVMSYDFTGPLDILPGNITPNDWYEKIIQYYISEEIPRNKFIMGINTNAYEWPEREIAYDPITNYSVLNHEAAIIPRDKFKEMIASNAMQPLNDNKIEEEVYKYTTNNKKYLTIFPPDKKIKDLEKLSSEYGIYGVFYK